nr:unnamed protein product [Callosobruchus analis]
MLNKKGRFLEYYTKDTVYLGPRNCIATIITTHPSGHYLKRTEEDIHDEERRLSGIALAHVVIDQLKKFGLCLENCVGVGTDGCAVMVSEVRGAVQEILKYSPCARPQALEGISKWNNPKTTSDARSLIKATCDAEFIISIICLSDVLSITRPLSLLLQAPSLDLIHASEALKNTASVLQNYRECADTHFSNLFAKITNVAEELDVEIIVRRTVKRQNFRANFPMCSAEEYYRKAIFIYLIFKKHCQKKHWKFSI